MVQRAALSDLDDAALLVAVATKRNRAAYQELYVRYKRKAYSQARYLAGSNTSADEAFQEGMLRVWIYAKSFKPDGNARAWILRTVAREALKKAKAARKDDRAKSLDESIQAPVLDAPAGHNPEREELFAGLRDGLERLAPGLRRLVLLYYVAGLTQQEKP
ncbi:MAG: RNA polymerase sigma factor [Planctomycetes bacterium]|nr:RNA polymerase sigma factor [Planctomycetota bacterium]